MGSSKKDIERAAYGYVYTRTWIPPFDLDCMWEESRHAFEEGAIWALAHYRNCNEDDNRAERASTLAEKTLNWLDRPILGVEGDTLTAIENRLKKAKETLEKIKNLR